MNEEIFARLAIPGTIQARLDKDLREQLNDCLHDFLPDGMSADEITSEDIETGRINRSIIVNNVVRVALMKTKVSANTKQLLETIEEQKKSRSKLAEEKETEIFNLLEQKKELEREIEQLEFRIENTSELLNNNATTIFKLTQEKENLIANTEKLSGVLNDETRIEIHLNKYQLIVVNNYLDRLSTKLKKQISASQLFFNLFWRYITKQETELGEFSFVISPAEIKQLLIQAKQDETQISTPTN